MLTANLKKNLPKNRMMKTADPLYYNQIG